MVIITRISYSVNSQARKSSAKVLRSASPSARVQPEQQVLDAGRRLHHAQVVLVIATNLHASLSSLWAVDPLIGDVHCARALVWVELLICSSGHLDECVAPSRYGL